jgi:hypothetical protein
MTKNLKKSRFLTAEIPANALVQTYYCALELNAPPGSDGSLRLAGRGR